MKLVLLKVEPFQLGQLSELGGERPSESIFVEPQVLQVGQLAYLGRNGSNHAVLGQAQLPQIGQEPNLGRYGSSFGSSNVQLGLIHVYLPAKYGDFQDRWGCGGGKSVIGGPIIVLSRIALCVIERGIGS